MSASLSVSKDGQALERHELAADQRRVLIGRNEDCDVRLDSSGISRHHCELLLEDGFHRLRDLGSRHGTFLNGRRTSESSLDDGDVLTVGAYQLTYASRLPRAERTAPRASAAHGLPTLDAPVEAAPAGQATTRRTAHVLYEEQGALKTALLQETTFLIGRARSAQLRLGRRRDPLVAALVLRERTGFRVWDTSPRANAVWVNGRPTRDEPLRDGDLVVVCGRPLRFRAGLPKLDALQGVETRDVLRPGPPPEGPGTGR